MEEDPVTYLRRLFNEETYQSGYLLSILYIIYYTYIDMIVYSIVIYASWIIYMLVTYNA